jgi:hypothetical protein
MPARRAALAGVLEDKGGFGARDCQPPARLQPHGRQMAVNVPELVLAVPDAPHLHIRTEHCTFRVQSLGLLLKHPMGPKQTR